MNGVARIVRGIYIYIEYMYICMCISGTSLRHRKVDSNVIIKGKSLLKSNINAYDG